MQGGVFELIPAIMLLYSVNMRIGNQHGDQTMSEHSFTLILDGDIEGRLDALFEAGCDDATFGCVDDVSYRDFHRTAPTLVDAIASAISAVELVHGLRVTRVEPDDLVTAAEIAERLGRTRESVRLLIARKRGAGTFPAPVSHLRVRNRLWRWSDVAAWAGGDASTITTARTIAAVNAALELRSTTATLPDDARTLVASLEHG